MGHDYSTSTVDGAASAAAYDAEPERADLDEAVSDEDECTCDGDSEGCAGCFDPENQDDFTEADCYP